MRMAFAIGCAALAMLCGCSSTSPYDYSDSWLIMESPLRPFVVPADIIYVQGTPYTKGVDISELHAYANSEVGRGKFASVARVFSPLVANADDVEEAMSWYFEYHHEAKRPFVLIGEGECGRMLKEYEVVRAKKLRKMGLVASYYTNWSHEHFVTEEMVAEIKQKIANVRYRHVWDREMPEKNAVESAETCN